MCTDDFELMSGHFCSIIPPHLLQAIVDSDDVDEDTKSHARRTLDATNERHRRRREEEDQDQNGNQGIVPDHVLSGIAQSEAASESERQNAAATLEHSQALRADREQATLDEGKLAGAQINRVIYDMRQNGDQTALPGVQVRVEGSTTPSADPDVNATYDNFGHTWDFYYNILGRNSIDNKGLKLIGSVNFGDHFENAFWNRSQMVFGDGGTFIYKFCQSLDVIGHELTHGVTQYTAQLGYKFQYGALNESISDVFGSLVEQYTNNETAEQADWLIGEDCLFPGVKGVALRSMKAPGTAYNDPKVGKDPQPDRMSKFVNLSKNQDNGGVHINSGIPNRAFFLSAVGFGGYAWEKAGKIWYAALTDPKMTPTCSFEQFANITTSLAGSMFDSDAQEIVRQAWVTVEVLS